jgi:[histone H3]-lysine36 N-dimethyltransferase SETMAR
MATADRKTPKVEALHSFQLEYQGEQTLAMTTADRKVPDPRWAEGDLVEYIPPLPPAFLYSTECFSSDTRLQRAKRKCCDCPDGSCVSQGLATPLAVRLSRCKNCGWGVYVKSVIRAGQFVCEYVGEIIGSTEAEKRRELYKAQGLHDNYILTVREHLGDRVLRTTIDPTIRGNVARFINHSCEPNLNVEIVRCGSLVPR